MTCLNRSLARKMKRYGVIVHETKSQLIHGKQRDGTTLLLLFLILKSPWGPQQRATSHTSQQVQDGPQHYHKNRIALIKSLINFRSTVYGIVSLTKT